jgi:phosphoglycerol geranylgeranyltransferase
MRYVYLEAGSGAKAPVPPSMIKLVRKYTSTHLVVGGGIRNAESAKAAKNAGAEIIVTGTLVEESNGTKERINEIVSSITA